MLAALSLAVACLGAEPSATPPNVVLILADDLGWNSVGYHNAEFQTPHLDGLVAEGLEFDHFYVAPMCSPTRAGLMTGRFPIRFGLARAVIPPYRDFGLPSEETTIPEALDVLGYERRSAFGKWHLGHRRGQWHPLNQGFTHFHGHYNGAIDYFELSRDGVRDWHEDDEPSNESGYSTDLIADAAATWIADAAGGEAPYFCYVPFSAPHSPFQAPEHAIGRFTGDADLKSLPQKERDRIVLQAMIWEMDRALGRILDAIEATGEKENTLVWFLSDNGGVGDLRDLNVPLRGAKLTSYEGGIRVPACVRWPARIAPGGTAEALCGYVDVLPTLLRAAGPNAAEAIDAPLDGVNLLPLFDEPTADPAPDRPWFTYHGQSGPNAETLAVTQRGWKLVVNGPRPQRLAELTGDGRRIELFHLTEDPYEQRDRKEDFPDKVRELGELLIAHRDLQPEDAIPPYSNGRGGFVPPPLWQVDADDPDTLVGGRRSR